MKHLSKSLKFTVSLSVLLLVLSGCGGGSSSSSGETGGEDAGDGDAGGGDAGGGDAGGGDAGDGDAGGGDTGGGDTGGGDTGDGDTGGGDAGGGDAGGIACVDVPRPVAGQKYKLKLNNLTAATGDLFSEFNVRSFTSTKSVYDTVTTGTVNGRGTKTSDYSITSGFLNITKVRTIDINTTQGITVTNDSTQEFNPFFKEKMDEFCTGDTWTSTYNLKTTGTITAAGFTTTSPETNTSVSTTNEVEAINVSKTVIAGTFNTVQVRKADGTTVITTWTDIATGIPILQSTSDNTGTVEGTQELISIN